MLTKPHPFVRRYDDLVTQASAYVKDSSVDSITIPVGPRLGDLVLEAQDLTKGFADRVLLDKMNVNIPPGAVVGIIGGELIFEFEFLPGAVVGSNGGQMEVICKQHVGHAVNNRFKELDPAGVNIWSHYVQIELHIRALAAGVYYPCPLHRAVIWGDSSVISLPHRQRRRRAGGSYALASVMHAKCTF